MPSRNPVWGLLRYLREDVKARIWAPITAIIPDMLALGGFVWFKLHSDPFVIGVAVIAMTVIAAAEQTFLKRSVANADPGAKTTQAHRH